MARLHRVQGDSLISLDPARRHQAGALLARAFHADPLYEAAVPDAQRRMALLTWLLARVVHYTLLRGHVHTTPALEGVACWLAPGRTELTLGGVVRSGLYATPLKMGREAYRRFDLYQRLSGRLHHRHAPQPHWYLWVIGVDPPCQGQGIGSRLLVPMLHRMDAEGIACYLETGSEQNVRFYEKHGFHVESADRVPTMGVPVWAMRREARSAGQNG